MYPFLYALFLLTSITTHSHCANVASNAYTWNEASGNNTVIQITPTPAGSFSTTFNANATNDLTIGLYSPNYSRPGAPNGSSLGAIIECVIGGWDDGSQTKGNQQSCVRIETNNANLSEHPTIFFCDTQVPHVRYILPGDRGQNIMYTCTTTLTTTSFLFSITYVDPLSHAVMPFLSITHNDLPGEVWDYLRSASFPGFSAVGFRAYDSPYSVTPVVATPAPQPPIPAIPTPTGTIQGFTAAFSAKTDRNVHIHLYADTQEVIECILEGSAAAPTPVYTNTPLAAQQQYKVRMPQGEEIHYICAFSATGTTFTLTITYIDPVMGAITPLFTLTDATILAQYAASSSSALGGFESVRFSISAGIANV